MGAVKFRVSKEGSLHQRDVGRVPALGRCLDRRCETGEWECRVDTGISPGCSYHRFPCTCHAAAIHVPIPETLSALQEVHDVFSMPFNVLVPGAALSRVCTL
jgi:hypothetical protein